MDNFDDAESHHSYQSDSLHSNASSLTGLSFYGNEFAELRHLINPSKYPSQYLERSSTPKAELTSFENEELVNILKTDLQRSLELNEQYKNDIQNLEKQIELKFYNKIDKLLRNNTRLEGELENANSQIERIIKNYDEKSQVLVAKEKFDLEKEIYQLTATNSSLQIQCANLGREKDELDFEIRNLRINLGELLTDKEIKTSSIQCLKQKISEQHIELQNCRKNDCDLLNKLGIIDTKLEQSERSRDWYKTELHQCQRNVHKLEGERLEGKNQIASVNQKISTLNIELSKYKSDIDRVRLQALKEKEELFKKLENIILNCKSVDNLTLIVDNKPLNNISENNVNFYKLTIDDLTEELSRIKINIQEQEEAFEKLKQENCDLTAKCLMLQKNLQQNEFSIELLESSKKELLKKLEYLKENDKRMITNNLQQKNRLTELEVELKIKNEDKQSVENMIRVIRNQFLKFKESYEKVKSELNLKNKEILQLQQEKQELFMRNNWTICELEKTKEKDIKIDNLKKDIITFETHIQEQTLKIKDLQFQILRNERTINEKENTISEKIQELENHNSVIIQYKELTSDYENKINYLQGKVRDTENDKNELEENFNTVKEELNKKDLKLDKALKTVEQLQHEHKNVLQNASIENNRILDDNKTLEEKYNHELKGKDACINDLLNKFKKLQNDCENYKKRITDDQKAEMLLNLKNAHHKPPKDVIDFKGDLNGSEINNSFNLSITPNNLEKIVMNCCDNLNIEELESTVEIRLKYLNEKLQKIKTTCEDKMEKFKNQYGRDKIREFEICLQVKDRDMKEKQKKMDRNNRTLLRKVKEHMRGRNSAEKQLKYIQDMYNALSEECNTLKLSLGSKEYTLQTLEKLCENYKNQSEKSRNAVLNLEKDLSRSKLCEKCLEMDQLKTKLSIFKELEEMNLQLKNKLRSNEANIHQLTEKVKEQDAYTRSLQEKINNLSRENEEHKTLLTTSRDLEEKYTSQNNLIQELSQKLTDKENICVSNYSIIESLNEDLEQSKENILCLSGKIKILSSDLQQKVEYSEELLQNQAKLESDFYLKNTENQNLIGDLRKSLVLLQTDIENLKNDKFFLQRLSNDLKIALQSYVDYNKGSSVMFIEHSYSRPRQINFNALEEQLEPEEPSKKSLILQYFEFSQQNLNGQLNILTKEKQQFNSLPPNILGDVSISGKYDVKYITQLLEESSVPVKKSSTTEIQDCLSKLREEIFTLQDQIIKKSSVGS